MRGAVLLRFFLSRSVNCSLNGPYCFLLVVVNLRAVPVLVLVFPFTRFHLCLHDVTEGCTHTGDTGGIFFHRRCFLVAILGLDRKRNGAFLTIHSDELSLERIAYLENCTSILDPIAIELRYPDVSFDAIAEHDDGTAGIHFADLADHDAAL